MSDQGALPGAGATGSDGVETRAIPTEVERLNGAQQPPEWLGPIEARMDELRDQQAELVERLGNGYDDIDYYNDDFAQDPDDEDWEALGIEPSDLDEIEGEDGEGVDIFDLINQSIDSRLAVVEADELVEQREDDFDDLRDEYPLLQHEPTARAIVNRAAELANAWNPAVIERPEFVNLIELVTKAAMADRAIAEQRPGEQPRVVLEAGVGATPHDHRPQQADWGDRIVAAAERLRPRI